MIISEMQRKLATWAATDPSRRISRLLRLITQPEWLAEAARITLSSKGAHTPGVDGVNKAKLQAGLSAELQRPQRRTSLGSLPTPASQTGLYPEKQRQTATTGYPSDAGSYCSAGHADGDGADMGE